MKRVELLAPAGDYKAFAGAIHAGADAVYLGGPRFGARAYAQNFTEEEVCRAVRYAHLFGRRVYLTLNTLMKESEMEQLYDYLCPFYEAGLDGVIVQDMGVAAYVRRQFPEMELHISTQAAVTGRYGAGLLKEAGAVRIVPARELSLQEIRHMKEDTGLEIETFIHGAVCYCYSGQCLFSSMLGGRSGNRGRCAQPCRLPYSGQGAFKKEELYPLSLKDMCTIEHIPELIEAGIDSFKIEGRMKKAEYAAGVTAIYRNYIDRYYANPEGTFEVEEKDLEHLKSLYIRSGLQDGYYHRHNGREMVTLRQPGYAGSDEVLLQDIRERYLEKELQLPVRMKAFLRPGEPAVLSLTCRDVTVEVEGMIVQEAQKRPLTREDIVKQFQKTGETAFWCEDIQIQTEGEVFLPVKALNELRREAFFRLEEKLLAGSIRVRPKPIGQEKVMSEQTVQCNDGANPIRIEVLHISQALAALKEPGLDRLYLPAECFQTKHTENGIGIGSVLAQVELYRRENPGFSFYMALPYIFRERSERFMEEVWRNLQIPQVDGVLVRNLEEIGWLRDRNYQKAIQTDAGLYVWNREAERFFGGLSAEVTLPYELSRKELKLLNLAGKEMIVYGRTPLMVTANCVRKTLEQCILDSSTEKKAGEFYQLTDRYRKNFPVRTNCEHCYNVIYNSVPTSLHHFAEKIKEWKQTALRFAFTTENAAETEMLTRFLKEVYRENIPDSEDRIGEYTSVYFKRGVE
ncbi:MAG: U32 family peptidase [Lachnospiraceae bacterium]|nr:U32 family peptidase [Lachnospiraceae bacterium]